MNAVEEIVDAVKDLSVPQRELVADFVLASLDGEELEVDQAWLEEAEERYRRYQADPSTAIPAEDVLAEARKARLA